MEAEAPKKAEAAVEGTPPKEPRHQMVADPNSKNSAKKAKKAAKEAAKLAAAQAVAVA